MNTESQIADGAQQSANLNVKVMVIDDSKTIRRSAETLLKKVGGGRIAAHEIMIGTPAIRNLIREGKIAQMYSAIQTGMGDGMQTLDQNLADLMSKGLINKEEARFRAVNKENF